MTKKILFVFHEDSQSGAPNALLTFLKYVKEHHSNAFIIDILVLNSKGGLEKQLKEVSRNFYKNQKKKTFFGKIFKTLQPNIWLLQLKNNYDVVYGNTVVTLALLSKFKQKHKNAKTILHIHESQYLCSLFLKPEKAVIQFKNIDKILAVAQFSADNLINSYEVSSEKIVIVHPTVEKKKVIKQNPLTTIYKENDLILTNIGHPNLTKGTDLIPQIANILRKRNPVLKFKILVVGVLNNNEYIKAIQLDIQKLNLENYIELIPHTKTPLNYLEISDAYMITSREDSFTLMGIQAAVFEKPIITFNKNTGLTEVLDEECTYQADYLNILDFVEKIELMYKNPDVTSQKIAFAKKKHEEVLDFTKCNEKHFIELKRFIQ